MSPWVWWATVIPNSLAETHKKAACKHLQAAFLMDSDAESSLWLTIGFADGQAAKAKGQSQQQRQITEKRKRQIRPH